MDFVEPIKSVDDLENMCNVFLSHSKENETILKKNMKLRNYTMFMLGIYSGLRISDILKLKIKDVKNKKQITLREMKTGKHKSFPINKILKKVLDEYLEQCEREDHEFLIKSQKGYNKSITAVQAYRIIKRAADKVQLENIGTHSMRKTFGYHYYKKTKDVATLQKIFNHTEPSTTLRYIGIDQEHINKVYDDLKYF